MKFPGFHLCHLNIGEAKGPPNSPVMEGFFSRLDEFNELAYNSRGFVWHLKIDITNPQHWGLYQQPGFIFNMSVWDSMESLEDYTYRSRHQSILKYRYDWLERSDDPNYVLWWKPEGMLPTLDEGKTRINHLKAFGSTAQAFTFKDPFPPQTLPAEIALHRPVVPRGNSAFDMALK